MPRYYYLFPDREGPYANPFAAGDRLFLLSQDAVLQLRGLSKEADEDPVSGSDSGEALPLPVTKSEPQDYSEWQTKKRAIELAACRAAFVLLANRILRAEPPTESHWDYAVTEAARRVMALCFYIEYEAEGVRMSYWEKRDIEVLLTEWVQDAKDVWRSRNLRPGCRTLLEYSDGSTMPRADTWLLEEMWKVCPGDVLPPSDIREEVFRPADSMGLDPSQLQAWSAAALQPGPAQGHEPKPEQSRGAIGRARQPRLAASKEEELRAKFPQRAAWLADRLLERGWSSSDPSGNGGPDRKTVEKILRGESVRNDVLERLATALSTRKHPKVSVLDIPQD